ncbi:GIN domain-containing protein [Aquimarina agarilytica]|uniref:GIN domain-containing protein n=1 Tax=Aquimarina agarilytica TaxID=1087449 RepID=UPI00028A1430|nr:DUF2807 domain-containing protein [Aquimarina agarilytica]
MKKLILFTFLILISNLSNAQSVTKIKGNKIPDTKSLDISDFRILEIGEKFEVILVPKSNPSVYIEADSNLLEFIDVKVDAEKLTVKSTRTITRFKKLSIEIGYTPSLSKIITTGRTTIASEGTIEVERLAIEAYESSNLTISTKADRVDILGKNNARIVCEISASSIGIHNNDSSKISANIVSENLNIAQNQQSKIEIQGTSTKNTLFLLDSCNFYGSDLITTNTSLSIEGASYAYLNVTDKLELKVSGKSEVSLLSNPIIDLLKFQDEAVLKKIKKAPSTFKRLFE